MIELNVNGETHPVDVDPNTPLLWVLRDTLGLTGTRYGCGMGLCGACTVHYDGMAVRSCVLPVAACAGIKITTIEALDHPVREAWVEHQVPQCGYCQSGQIMAASAFLNNNPRPTSADIHAGVTNLCRCATYQRIHKAIHACAAKMPPPPPPPEASPLPGSIGTGGTDVAPALAPAGGDK